MKARGARKYDRRAILQRQMSVDDGHGGRKTIWGELARPWVRATPIGGKEALGAGTLHASQGWRIEMSARDVTTEDRLAPLFWKGMKRDAVLNIRSVADAEGERAELVLLCDTRPTA